MGKKKKKIKRVGNFILKDLDLNLKGDGKDNYRQKYKREVEVILPDGNTKTFASYARLPLKPRAKKRGRKKGVSHAKIYKIDPVAQDLLTALRIVADQRNKEIFQVLFDYDVITSSKIIEKTGLEARTVYSKVATLKSAGLLSATRDAGEYHNELNLEKYAFLLRILRDFENDFYE